MNFSDWTFRFIHGFRCESRKLEKEKRIVFEPLVKEQMLSETCQVEVIKFYFPYRIFLLFFFDRTKPDSSIYCSIENWNNVSLLIEKLVKKYNHLKLQKNELYKIFSRFKECENSYLYSIDSMKDVCHITFSSDPQVIKSPFPDNFGRIMKAWEVAEMIFNQNYSFAHDFKYARGHEKS